MGGKSGERTRGKRRDASQVNETRRTGIRRTWRCCCWSGVARGSEKLVCRMPDRAVADCRNSAPSPDFPPIRIVPWLLKSTRQKEKLKEKRGGMYIVGTLDCERGRNLGWLHNPRGGPELDKCSAGKVATGANFFNWRKGSGRKWHDPPRASRVGGTDHPDAPPHCAGDGVERADSRNV